VRAAHSLIVPYCGECLRHASAQTTRNLAAVVASCLIAGTLAFSLPIATGALGLIADVAIVFGIALIPLVVRLSVRARPRPNHASAERAVWWSGDGELYCANARWARELAEANSAEMRSARVSEPRFASWLLVGPLSGLVLAPAGWYLHHPQVRVLDLNETRIALYVDGRHVADVEPTSAESTLAGIEIRIPAGEHELEARGPDGNAIHKARVNVRSGRHHLYAPGGERHCFWLEEARYGRLGSEPARVDPLTGVERFWVLPRRVDTWFAPNPAPPSEQQWSGGVLVALRQALCSEAPAER
jgi:hypothetical protein